jgi:uncharacterized membrane protein
MKKQIIEFLISCILFLLFDFAFLIWNRNVFESQIIEVQRVALKLKWEGGIACYFFLLFGLYYFILKDHRSPLEAFMFGIVVYGVYETTSFALLKKWKWKTVFVDTIWGGTLFYLTTFFTYYLSDRFLK